MSKQAANAFLGVVAEPDQEALPETTRLRRTEVRIIGTGTPLAPPAL